MMDGTWGRRAPGGGARTWAEFYANTFFSLSFSRFNFYKRSCYLKENYFKETTNDSIKERFFLI